MRSLTGRRWPSLVGLFVVFVVIPLVLWMCSGPRVIVKTVARDGTKMCVIQEFDGYGTLGMHKMTYRTFFFARKGEGPWRGYPVSLNDQRTTPGDWYASAGADRVVFYRENRPAITFETGTRKYVLHGSQEDFEGVDFERLPVDPW